MSLPSSYLFPAVTSAGRVVHIVRMYQPTSPSRQHSEEKLNSSNFSTDIRLVSRLTNIAFEVERGKERWERGGGVEERGAKNWGGGTRAGETRYWDGKNNLG